MGKDSLNYLICCCFGQSQNLLKGAIDKAYADMASHTLKVTNDCFADRKWAFRYNASCIIYRAIKNYQNNRSDYSVWHNDVINQIRNVYSLGTISEGQIQSKRIILPRIR